MTIKHILSILVHSFLWLIGPRYAEARKVADLDDLQKLPVSDRLKVISKPAGLKYVLVVEARSKNRWLQPYELTQLNWFSLALLHDVKTHVYTFLIYNTKNASDVWFIRKTVIFFSLNRSIFKMIDYFINRLFAALPFTVLWEWRNRWRQNIGKAKKVKINLFPVLWLVNIRFDDPDKSGAKHFADVAYISAQCSRYIVLLLSYKRYFCAVSVSALSTATQVSASSYLGWALLTPTGPP